MTRKKPFIRNVLFDLGNTLLDYKDGESLDGRFRQGAQRAYALLAKFGFVLPPFERFHRSIKRRLKRAYLLKRLSKKEVLLSECLQPFFQRMGLHLTPEQSRKVDHVWWSPFSEVSELCDGARECLRYLRSRGISLGIISNTFVPSYLLEADLARHKIRDQFQVRLYSCDFGIKKPFSAFFREALAQLGARPRETAIVGDKLREDIVGGARLGLTTILRAKDPSKVRKRLRYKPDFVITSLAQLPALLKPHLICSANCASEA